MAMIGSNHHMAVPVFCLPCDGRRTALRTLRQTRGIRLVDSPRHATVLVVSGDISPEMIPAVRRVHDQVPAPRGVALWNCSNGSDVFDKQTTVIVEEETGPAEAIAGLRRSLMEKEHPGSFLFGPRQNPVKWQGTGDHGQGGEGMMGGKPYGRPMAMTGGDIRDGLMLGSFQFELGPFISWMPPGLRLSVTLQGDVIQEISCKAPGLDPYRDMPQIFKKALNESVLLAELEIARARHHLEAVSDLLYLLELDGYGLQALDLAAGASAGKAGEIRRFERKLRRAGLFLWATRGVARIKKDEIAALGPVARAAGSRQDERSQDPAYKGLDFEPIYQEKGDAAAICAQRLAEAAQALELAGRAGERMREPGPALEGPRGPMGKAQGQAWQPLLENQAKAMAWDDFATFLVSLDLDVSALPSAEDYANADQAQED